MRIIHLIFAALLLCVAPARAQSPALPTIIQAQINSEILSCGTGCISGAELNSILNRMAVSYGGLLAVNAWTGLNTFSGSLVSSGSVNFQGSLYFSGTGYVYANGPSSPATFTTSATSPIAANSIVGNNTGSTGGPYALTASQAASVLGISAIGAGSMPANTIAGNNTGSAASVAALTPAQVSAMIGIAGDPTNLFINPQWQILDNTATQINQVGPQSISTLPSFTVTGSSSSGTTIPTFNVSGSPNINVNDLVSLSGGTINAAIANKIMRVISVTGNPVTSFSVVTPLSVYGPSSSQSGAGQIVNLGDLGSAIPATGQYWSKSTTLQFWPTSYIADLDPGALRCLGVYMGGVAGATGTPTQNMGQQLSAPLVQRLHGQTITVSFRVQQRVKGGSGTSQAYLNINGSLYFGAPVTGGGSYEDVRITYAIPANATSIYAGVNFSGASTDAYYVCKPHMAVTPSLPVNYFTEIPNDYLQSNMDIVPYTLNGASVQFPSTVDATGAYYSLYHDPFSETNGRVHWSVTCIQFTTEAKIASPGAALGWRNIIGNSGGTQIIYGTPTYPAVAGIYGTSQNRMPTDRGGQTNSIAPGFLILYSPTSAAAFTNVSMDVQGYCLN